MEVSGISNSSALSGIKTSASGQIESHRSEKSDKAQEHRHEKRSHERPPALNVFRQELRTAIETRFRAKIAISLSAYAQQQGDPDSGDVSREALGSARQLVSEAPTNTAKALISFRAVVHETASYVREALGAQDDLSDVDGAVARVDKGLDALESTVARNQESVATALEINTRSKQRSTIKIRTQEGDIVKLSIKRSERMSASDVATITGGKSSSLTEIEVSSRSRMMLSVDGDLNDEEFAAIQNVFAQAESIANQFFNGDISAAFDMAAGFEFDAEQLARVNMGFRSYQSTNIAYTETTRLAPVATQAIKPEPAASDNVPVANTPLAAPTIVEAAEIKSDDASIPPVAQTPASPSSPQAPTDSSLSDLFGLISDFLRSVGEGFVGSGGSDATSVQFHYSESFKLTLLSAVLNVAAPDESDDAASTASALIGGIAGVFEQENEK